MPRTRPIFKLYLSPETSSIRKVLGAVLPLLDRRVIACKTGATMPNLLRPDKVVVYFRRRDDLEHHAQLLRERLEGIPPHGVPFTSEVGGAGLLSWAMDPPAVARRKGTLAGGSWRGLITRRLAEGLIGAADAGLRGAAARARALRDLDRQGIDTLRWLPRPSLIDCRDE